MHRLTLRLIICCALFACCACGGRSEDFADQLPRIAPTEPSDAIGTIEVADGFQIELVASEPLVNSPVAIEWDSSGAMFVCEMRGYSENRDDKLSRISRLVDDNNDGVYERRTTFVDQLLWPTALFPYDGGLFVADAPDIYYFKDHDGDGVADHKEVVFTGFSIGNVQGLLNSFRWGLDNRIHLACGTVGGKIRGANDDASTAVEVRGHDLAFDPRTFEFELTSGGAQHGMCFDDWGRKFVSSNSDHLQQVMYEERYIMRNPLLAAPSARQSIAADGPQAEVFRISPVEPWRIVRTRLRVAGLVGGPVEGGGRAAGYFTGATGVTIYRGDSWPERFRNLAIIGDVGSNLIHRKRLTRRGVQMLGERMDPRSEFVASTDNWFRPAQFACGPDGNLSVVDVYREVIEHPKSLPPEIKQHLDLTSGRDRGRIYRIVPDSHVHRLTINLDDLSTDKLVPLLAHANAWHRETAARLIFQRQDKSAEDLLRQQSANLDSPLARLHALYALQGLDLLTTNDVLARLKDSHPQVLRHAIRLSESFQNDDLIVRALKRIVQHPSADVRYQLAFSLGEFSFSERSNCLAQLLMQDPTDRWIQTAVESSSGPDLDRLFVSMLESSSRLSAAPFLERLAKQIDHADNAESRRLCLNTITKLPDQVSLLPTIGRLHRQDRRTEIGPSLFDSVELVRARLVPLAIERATNESNDDRDRIQAIRWLSETQTDPVIKALDQIVRSGNSSELQVSAVRALGRFDSELTTGTLIACWPQWSPRLRRVAGDVLFSSVAGTSAMLDAIESGRIHAQDVSASRWNTLASTGPKSLRKRIARHVPKSTKSSRDAVIKRYRSATVSKGDPARGKTVFTQQCAGCHKSGEIGLELGPSLTAAATRGADSILTNVLDPNREVNPQYFNYVVLTEDGHAHGGMIVSENTNSITLRRAESVSETLLRSEIELIRNTNLSIMPEGFEKAISPQAMADLVQFLIDQSRRE